MATAGGSLVLKTGVGGSGRQWKLDLMGDTIPPPLSKDLPRVTDMSSISEEPLSS